MALVAGDRIGPYEIVGVLGAGGMGEVYKANDTRLHRTVAIKVLPEHVASDPDLKQRFEREAKTLAAVSHPHICPIHDVGNQDGIDFLVMEYLEGETLEQRLKKGALPLDQALRMGMQVADALATAHRAGIVHRDLKPGNIMLTKSGTKLLDFGLAKTGAPAVAGSLSMLPTTPPGQTQPGTILGTFQYMAPEQLEGQDADARTDIFAFGSVMYEVVTGRRAFEGKSQASLISAIMSSEPPALTTLQPPAPPALDRLIKSCLAKDPDARWSTAHDVLLQLTWIAETRGQSHADAPIRPNQKRSLAVIAGTAGLLLGAALGGAVVWAVFGRDTPTPSVSTRLLIAPGPAETLPGEEATSVAISPDGQHVVYVGRLADGRQQLYLRPLDRLDATPISGTEGAIFPFFSPDGEWIAFFSYGDRKFKTVSSRGGAPVPLFDASDLRGASWGPDGTIVFTPGVSAGISRISAAGGTPQILTTPDAQKGERSHRFPQLLPGSKFLIFTLETNDLLTFNDAQIVLQSLETGERRTLVHGGSDARYSSSGHLVYVRAGTLLAVPFDLTRGQVTGPPVTVLDGVRTNPSAGNGQYAFSETGSLVYLPGTGQSPSFRLVWVDRSGMARPLLERPEVYYDPKLSPDGRRLMVAVGGADDQLWSVDVSRGTLTRFTVEPGDHSGGIWTPDGKRVVFSSNRGGPFNLFWKLADGTGSEERLAMSQHAQWPHAVTPDGALLVFDQVEPTTRSDIWVLPLHGTREPRPLLRSRFSEWGGTVSPDGKWLAFISDESGRDELYVQAFPSAGEKWLVSKEGGIHPRWTGNGELFYRSGNRLMAVAVSASPSFRSEEPRLLFAGMYDNPTVHPYDVTADGRQVVMLQRETPAEPTPIVVVQGWLNQVRQRAQSK